MHAESESELTMARDAGNSFIFPPSREDKSSRDYSDNLVFEEGSTIDLSWNSDYQDVILILRQVLNCVGGGSSCDFHSTLFRKTSFF